jgi:tRNA(adenine34) deaminase
MTALHPMIAALDLEQFMREALEQVRIAGLAGGMAIGAVLVIDRQVIARGHNTCESEQNQILHAEINALMNGAKPLWDAGDRWAMRENAVLFTTVEPCPMCLGATVMADIPHIVFAAHDGNVCSSQSVRENPYIKRHIQTYLGGILETESRALIAQFSPEMLPSLDRVY